jgi:hypothetical protein
MEASRIPAALDSGIKEFAGLSFFRAWVWAGPPLLASGPRPGLVTPNRSPGKLKSASALPPPIRLTATGFVAEIEGRSGSINVWVSA